MRKTRRTVSKTSALSTHQGGSGIVEMLVLKASPLHLIAVIVIVSFGVYVNTLFNGFVYDDDLQILDNKWIRDVRNIPQIFSDNVWGFSGEHVSNYYRPLMHIIYMITYHIFGLAPWGFHLVNVLFHAGISVLVFVIVHRLLSASGPSPATAHVLPSLMAALLFATHPIHTEAVAWVSGMPEISFTLFSLMSFYLYLRSSDGGRSSKGMYLLSVAAFSMATLCKEPALMLPLLIVAYDLSFKKEKFSFTFYAKRYAPYLIVGGLYFVMRFNALQSLTPIKSHGELSSYELVINVFPLLMQYFQKLFLPLNLNAFHVFHPIASVFEMKGILSFTFISVLLFLFSIALKKSKATFFGLSLIIIPLLPALYIPAFEESAFAERYLYLPSVGFVFLFSLFLMWVKTNRTQLFRPLTLILAVLTILYAFATVDRNTVWKNNIALWSDTVKKSPESATIHGDMGVALIKAGRTAEGRQHLNRALELKPGLIKHFLDKGTVYFNLGWKDKAIEEFETALLYKPDSADAHINLGAAYGERGMIDKAIEHFEAATKLKPKDMVLRYNLAEAYKRRGLPRKDDVPMPDAPAAQER